MSAPERLSEAGVMAVARTYAEAQISEAHVPLTGPLAGLLGSRAAVESFVQGAAWWARQDVTR